MPLIVNRGGKRNPSFDYLKTLAISLVIIYHCGIFHDCITASFLSMCVPIFFCINGALMLRKEYSYVYLIRKNLKLFVLILTWGLIYSYVGSLTLHENIVSFKDIYHQIGKPLKGDHLWYLEELFCLNIFNPLIYAYIKNKTQVHILLLSLVFTIFTLNIIAFKIPFNLHPFSLWGSWGLIYYILGFWIIQCGIGLKFSRKKIFAMFVMFIAMQVLFNYLLLDRSIHSFFETSDLVPGGYQSPFVIFSTLSLVAFLCSKNMKSNKLITYIGKNSLGIYLFQGVVIRLLNGIFHNCFLFPIIVFVLCCLLVYIFSINKYTDYFINFKTLTTNKYDK